MANPRCPKISQPGHQGLSRCPLLGCAQWVGNGNLYSDDKLDYHVVWLDCAGGTWGVNAGYMGIWNERQYNSSWIKQLRNSLDAAGYHNTRLVAQTRHGTSWQTWRVTLHWQLLLMRWVCITPPLPHLL